MMFDDSCSPEREPPVGLLVSMAMRINHGFGGDSPRSQEVQLANMRKCWEEVVGLGFYRPQNDELYKSHIAPTMVVDDETA